MKKKYLFILFIVSSFVGCSIFENDDSSEVQLSIQGNTETLKKAINIGLNVNGWNKTLNGSDFGISNSSNYTQSFVTPKSGNLQVKFTLLDSTGINLNAGVIYLTIKPDWRWSINFVLSNHNPFYDCFGCTGYSGFGIDSEFQSTKDDSLFIIWGGNSIKNPVIY